MNASVSDLIKRAGGVDEVSAASSRTSHPITADAVHKWRKNGIPDVHWPIFIKKADATVEEIYRANEDLRRDRPRNEVGFPKRRSARVAA